MTLLQKTLFLSSGLLNQLDIKVALSLEIFNLCC